MHQISNHTAADIHTINVIHPLQTKISHTSTIPCMPIQVYMRIGGLQALAYLIVILWPAEFDNVLHSYTSVPSPLMSYCWQSSHYYACNIAGLVPLHCSQIENFATKKIVVQHTINKHPPPPSPQHGQFKQVYVVNHTGSMSVSYPDENPPQSSLFNFGKITSSYYSNNSALHLQYLNQS
jgi:hypothetical protein